MAKIVTNGNYRGGTCDERSFSGMNGSRVDGRITCWQAGSFQRSSHAVAPSVGFKPPE
jgi:hypothetical protein